MSTSVANVDIDALKQRLRATWMAGGYDRFSRFMESNAVEFLDHVGIPEGASLLDVACGSGQLALSAARRGARVTGVDIAANSIRAARERAQAEALPAQFDEGDAEALPSAGRQLRCGSERLRCHVRASPRSRRAATGPCVPARRDRRDGELDEEQRLD